MQRQSLRPGMGVHAGGQQGLETQAQTTFKESKTWAGKKPLAGAGRQGSECWLLRW